MKIASYIVGGIFMLCLMYGIWQLARAVNYSLSYEDMVQETIREMVKSEALR